MDGNAVFLVIKQGDDGKERDIGDRTGDDYPQGYVKDVYDAPQIHIHLFFFPDFLPKKRTLMRAHRLTNGDRRNVLSHISSTK